MLRNLKVNLYGMGIDLPYRMDKTKLFKIK